MNYEEFLLTKKANIQKVGFVAKGKNELLKDFQDYTVSKCIEHGRFAVFHDCGLGKTFQQLEIARIVCDEEKGKAIVLCPLAVSGQTIE